MNAKPLDIIVVCNSSDAKAYQAAIKSVCSDALVRSEESVGLVSNMLQHSQPDVMVLDWGLEAADMNVLCPHIMRELDMDATIVVAFTHNSLHSTRAIAQKVHHLVDLQDEGHTDAFIASAFRMIQRLMDAHNENKSLRSTIRTKETSEKQMICALERAIQVRFPEAADELPFLVHAVEWIVDQFRHEEDSELEKTQILHATHLAWLGKMHLPDSERTTRITLDGAPTNNYTAFVPLQADSILDGVDALAGARLILKNMYENYDGTGFPDRKQHWQIPLGSRILRAVCDLEELARIQRISMADAVEQLKRFNRHVYDHRIVALLEEYVLNVSRRSSDRAETRAVQLFDLKEGMQLASDIVTTSGLKLMNSGTVLRDQLIRRIQSHNAMDPIIGNVYVQD